MLKLQVHGFYKTQSGQKATIDYFYIGEVSRKQMCYGRVFDHPGDSAYANRIGIGAWWNMDGKEEIDERYNLVGTWEGE